MTQGCWFVQRRRVEAGICKDFVSMQKPATTCGADDALATACCGAGSYSHLDVEAGTCKDVVSMQKPAATCCADDALATACFGADSCSRLV